MPKPEIIRYGYTIDDFHIGDTVYISVTDMTIRVTKIVPTPSNDNWGGGYVHGEILERGPQTRDYFDGDTGEGWAAFSNIVNSNSSIKTLLEVT